MSELNSAASNRELELEKINAIEAKIINSYQSHFDLDGIRNKNHKLTKCFCWSVVFAVLILVCFIGFIWFYDCFAPYKLAGFVFSLLGLSVLVLGVYGLLIYKSIKSSQASMDSHLKEYYRIIDELNKKRFELINK